MTTRYALFASLCALAGPATAQLPTNPLRFYDQSIEFASRGMLGTGPGHVSQALTYGQAIGLSRLTWVRYVVQDQNGTTTSPWNVRLAGLASTGLPNYAAATTIAGPFVLPVTPGPIAYRVTHTFTTTPVAFPVAGDQTHVCVEWVAGANVSEMSLQMSNAPLSAQPPCSTNESPRVEAKVPTSEQLAWSGPPATPPTALPLSWAFDLGFAEPTLQGVALPYAGSPGISCVANTGYAALDPDFNDLGPSTPARFDDYQWQLEAGSGFAGGVAVLLHSQTVLNAPLAVPGISGRFYLDPLDPLFALVTPIALNASGSGSLTLGLATAPAAIRALAGSIPSWSTQAVVVPKSGPLVFSQLWTMRPRTAPPGFMSSSASSTTPLRITKPTTMQTFTIRNDGRGVLAVVLLAGTVRLGGATILERTMQTMAVPPAVTTIQITGARTGATNFVYR